MSLQVEWCSALWVYNEAAIFLDAVPVQVDMRIGGGLHDGALCFITLKSWMVF